jgi:hypothetical protein
LHTEREREREREWEVKQESGTYSKRLAVGIGLVGGGRKVFMRKRLGNNEILIDGGHIPPKKKIGGLGLANGKGEVEQKQLQFVVVAFIACLFGCIIVLSYDGDVICL